MLQRLVLLSVFFGLALASSPTRADAQFFGRNKVQYRSFDFKIIRTEHFDVYFYEEEREAALDAARMAERAYARLSQLLQHEFQEKKPIIVYASHSHFQQTNTIAGFLPEGTGAFAETLKSRVVIPLVGSYAEFDHVLRHELVHSFQHDILFRNAALDNANPFTMRMPLWFMEGMAEYLSIGHIDAITAAWLRDATLSGYIRTIAEMNRRDDYLSYRFGQALWAYIGSRWGDEVIGILLQRATRIGIERAFQTTLGMSLGELNDEWLATVRRTYLPQLAEFDRPAEFAEPLLQHEKLEDPSYLAPALSPDGKWLAVFSQHEGFFPDLWLVNAETGEFERRLIQSNREADFESLRYASSAASFSPDGRHIAFVAKTGGRDALYIYDVEQGELDRKLEFELAAMMTPTWSPDGRHIVFSGLDGGLSDLFITDLEGNLERLTSDRYADLYPSWSPDGSMIAFSTDRGEQTDFETLSYANLQVALYHLDSGEIETLPEQEEGRNVNPVWSPDSRSLIWISDRTGTKDLYLFDREQSRLYRMTRLLSGAMGPAATDLSPVLSWSRESGKLAFVYFEYAGQSVYTMDDPRAQPLVAVADLPDEEGALPLASNLSTSAEPGVVSPGAANPVPPGSAANGSADGGYGTSSEPADSLASGLAAASYYRGNDGFRQSDRLPEGVVAPEPVSVMTMLEDADFSLPDAEDFEVSDYKVRFTPDIVGRPTIGAEVGGYYGNGVYGGSYIALSDMLGNHNIMLAGSINGSFSDAMIYTGYSFLKNRTNLGFSVSQVPLYGFYGSQQFVEDANGQPNLIFADVWRRDVYRSVDAVISYPFSTFRRFELAGNLTSINQELILRGVNLSRNAPYDVKQSLASATYFRPSAALVFDNSYFGWTGPITGRRYRLQVSSTAGDFRFTEGMVDFRNYFNFNQKIVFATQLFLLTRMGEDGDNFFYYWGGPYFLRGYDGGSFDRNSPECAAYSDTSIVTTCPLQYQLVGSNAALFRSELRFPVITELQIGFLGNFPPVDAVVFFDGGLAWNNEFCPNRNPNFAVLSDGCDVPTEDVHLVWNREPDQDPVLYREPLFSYGVGLRINVFYTVLRLDYAFPLNRIDRSGRFSVSFGPSF